MTTPSSTVGHASAPVLSSHADPAVDGDVHRGLSVDSVARPDQTRSGSTDSSGIAGLTVKSLSENRLMECGYQVLENEVSDDDGVTSDELKQEKMSILELLRHEAKRYDSYENFPPAADISTLQSDSIVALQSNHSVSRNSSRAAFESSKEVNSSARTDSRANGPHRSLIDLISPGVIDFLEMKESIKRKIAVGFQGHVYSDFTTVASPYAYFSEPKLYSDRLHLIVCVHGLDGNSSDLRLVRIYLQLALPDCRLEFLMSECNQSDTFAGFDSMRDNLAEELIGFINELDEIPDRISFIGHSMGCVLVRALLLSPLFKPYLAKLHTFLSLSGPHLGTVYNSSGLVNMGMWVMQKWKKSESLAQLRLRDESNLRQTYMYRLNASPGLDLFRYVLLVSSPQDRYVPYHSTRIELCRAAVRDNSPLSIIYMEMVTNVLQRLIKSTRTTVVRYDVHYSFGSSANNLIGRAAHIAVLDSEIFLEKFICVSAAKYFR
ncbi:hypothetical protein EG68_09878 [Paragonimus skrjabini miyazakii]|uniref:DUF676 domain-containing protein n=1 Tax=Paragonimus skrjabini miyazakii TaxID=59628 RepID=A0A8S9YCK6_9TREM|nr:hypothetical protein EG68_09878 [Paragonimus skrjabini miyazakii]